MPSIITITNMKGGVGKSTLAYNLIHSFAASLKVAAVDTDFQNSITRFISEDENIRMLPVPDNFATLREADADIIVIDTPGYLSAQLPGLLKNSDLVIIPVKPGFWDYAALKPLVELIKEVQQINPYLKWYVALNMVNTQSKLTDEIHRLMEEDNLNILKSRVSNRVSYVRTLLTGGILKSDDLKAKFEIINLADEIITILQS